MSKRSVARLVLAVAVGALAWSVLLFATGGFVLDTAWIRLSSHDPFRPLVAAVVGLLAYWFLAPQQVAMSMERVDRTISRRGTLVAVVLALAVAAAGITYGTYAASGSDSYGYVSQADLWLTGHLRVDQRGLDLPPPFDDWALSPLGYHPGPIPHIIVPTYAPGLPLLMAAAKTVAGANGPYYVVPLMGALAVLVTFLLGRVLFDDLVGVAAAALFAVSPTFQFQLMWPMSDVPATAAWTLALVLAVLGRPFPAGLASAAAIVIRPNLVLLTIAVAVVALWSETQGRARTADLLRRCAWFGLGVMPGVVAIALLNAYLYGGPTVPSYTHLDSLFKWRNAGPNVARYVPWLLDTQTPFVLVALLPLASRRFTVPRTASDLPAIRIGVAMFLALLGLSYLFYQPFDDWWFLRFFLPGFPLLLVLAVGALRSTTPFFGRTGQTVLLAAVVIVVFGWELSTAQWRGVYDVRRGEQRYVTVGRELAEAVPANAVFLAMQHSGSLRYYTRRLTVRYDSLPPGSLDQALAVLRSRGFHPYFLLEKWEEAAFRDRFADRSVAGRIDWPPSKKWATPARVALYDPEERSKFARP
jgi:hypothetical protein